MTSTKKIKHPLYHETGLRKLLVLYLPLLLILVFLLFPFYWTLITSLTPGKDLYTGTVHYWPLHPTTDAYRSLFTSFKFPFYMKNSLIVAVTTTVLSLTVSMMTAYAFSRYRYKGRAFFMGLFLTNNMFPTVLLLIPLFTIMRKAGLLYSHTSLVLSYTTFTVPFSVWLLTGYLNDLPLSMEEAAMVDGANRAQAFIKIVLPVLVPCLLATGVYIFMQSWNEYVFAVLFTNTKTRTIPYALKNLIGELGVQWELLTAGGIITILPVCFMFFFAQKYLVAGLTSGAVKG